MNHPLLDKISSPECLNNLSTKELKQLAQEVRDYITEVLSKTGGHLASNLGIVELTLALHKVFNSPKDKFIFDVSHQTYVHKLLTGRKEIFETLRQTDGMSGFCHPPESSHDHFYAGHAGTALSLGLGVAASRDLANEDFHSIPIFGDASLTCGLTLEALNNIPKKTGKFICILNDNAMSISKNVGAITQILSRLINNPTANRVYKDIQKILLKVPNFGPSLAKHGNRIKESVKNLVSTAPFFEQFNLSYVGPIDGHDVKKLVETFEALKDVKTPTLVHVITTKGQGMKQATEKPTTYHGVKPFCLTTGEFLNPAKKKNTFPQIFGRHILSMAEKDPDVVAITPAMPKGSCLDPMMKQFPDRCIDVGIAEGHCVTYAGGMASSRKKKVVAVVYATFLQRALDNLFHDVCLQESPVLFALDRGGLAGADGITHNGIYDIGFLNAMPNIVIAQPRNGHLLKELLSSTFSWNAPTVIRYPNLPTDETDAPIKERVIGRGEVLKRGSDVLLVPLGHKCETAFEVAQALLEQGISSTIIDPVFVKPLDKDLLLTSIANHKLFVTIEEHNVSTGLGACINQLFAAEHVKIDCLNFGVPDRFIPHGSHSDLTKQCGLDSAHITKSILSHLNQGAHHENSSPLARS